MADDELVPYPVYQMENILHFQVLKLVLLMQ